MTIDMASSQQIPIVTGAQLPNFRGKFVSVFGVITGGNVHAGANSFNVNTTDNILLKVQLKKSTNEALESGGYIEVRGTCDNVGSDKIFKAEEYFAFKNKSFAANSHNDLCKFLNSLDGYNLKGN